MPHYLKPRNARRYLDVSRKPPKRATTSHSAIATENTKLAAKRDKVVLSEPREPLLKKKQKLLGYKETQYLELSAHIFHVHSGNTQTLYPHCFSMFPVIVDII